MSLCSLCTRAIDDRLTRITFCGPSPLQPPPPPPALPPPLPLLSAKMTMPNTVKLRLIFLASSSVCPTAPCLPAFSEPARSTRYRRPVRVERSTAPAATHRRAIDTLRIAWLPELCAFISTLTHARTHAHTSRLEATDNSAKDKVNRGTCLAWRLPRRASDTYVSTQTHGARRHASKHQTPPQRT